MKPLTAALAGALFALGLVISGMADPSKVVAFLDVTGNWDPTLMFVMAGAIGVHAPLSRLVRARRAPLWEPVFHLPTRSAIDPRLIIGAAVFGVGWGLSGYCPGPAIVSLGTGATPVLVFAGAMIAGIAITRLLLRGRDLDGRS
ncbi:MAG: YeeE/YedE family protein [Deltaproteobacteria bacterium]|nr:YeeE/YedE family protein [Deltaproteobacteria bacterium]